MPLENTIEWSPSSGVVSYDVYHQRCVGVSCASWILGATTTNTKFVHSGVDPGVSYNYAVNSLNSVSTTSSTNTMTVNTPVCPTCGNGVINSGEQCDGSNLNGQTCMTLGFIEGTLGCDNNCAFDKSNCVGCDPNVGTQCNVDECGSGVIQCDGSCDKNPKPANFGQPCGNCGTVGCSGSCENQGCNPNDPAQCVLGKLIKCNSLCLLDNTAGTDADGDGVDAECGDNCDTDPGIITPGPEDTPASCLDGLDNDCDGLTDCNDDACFGSVGGMVYDKNTFRPILAADVLANKNLILIKSSITDLNGNYIIAGIECGLYELIGSHTEYLPESLMVNILPIQHVNADIGLVKGTFCQADCTLSNDDTVHAACEGQSGCNFCDDHSKNLCDNSQPGWIRDYNETHFIICPSGCPQPKLGVEASVSCASGTIVKVTRIVYYNGKPVRLVVASCN